MTPENTKKLYDAFPRLYRELALPPHESAMGRIRCGDGWFDLIWKTSQIVAHRAAHVGLDPCAVLVREKFGGLCFRVQGGDDEIAAWIREVAFLSAWVCQSCGHNNRQEVPVLGCAPSCTACGGDLA